MDLAARLGRPPTDGEAAAYRATRAARKSNGEPRAKRRRPAPAPAPAPAAALAPAPEPAPEPPPPPPPATADQKGPTTLVLFYAYRPTKASDRETTKAVAACQAAMAKHGVTGRLRIAREGYNATLTSSFEGARAFCEDLSNIDGATFDGTVDFKYVDHLPSSHAMKGAKCWRVQEIVTYGIEDEEAPLHKGANHLSPQKFHEALEDPGAVVIDVRNANETLIGRFAPPGGAEYIDPQMRRSTEFPEWVRRNKAKLEGKKVLMYCTGGVRCERASAFLAREGIRPHGQLEGGIHRYLEQYPDEGGHWVGKNYVFDRRFAHGAAKHDVVSRCGICSIPWDRYQAGAKCPSCSMEVLVCRTCQRAKKASPKCHLCT
jgi:predicted sulfurtransferase